VLNRLNHSLGWSASPLAGLIHLAGLLFAVYRVALMGLLPVNVGDWSGSIVGGQRGEGWRGVQAAL